MWASSVKLRSIDKFLILLSIAALYGCSTMSLTEFKEAKDKQSFSVERDYYAVYLDVLAGARRCWATNNTSSRTEIDPHLYEDARRAEITQRLIPNGMGAPKIMFHVDIHVDIEEGTTVIVYRKGTKGAYKYLPHDVVDWANGDLTCKSEIY